MSIPTNYQGLSGFRTAYTETELRLAIAIAEAFIENNLGAGGGGGGGGSGITEAEVTSAIEAATNIDGLEAQLASLLSAIQAQADSTETQPVSLQNAIPSGTNNIGDVDVLSLPTITPAGNVASGSTDSGNPLKIGGVFRTTRPTFTDGQRGDLQITSRGGLLVDSDDVATTPNNIQTADVASTTTAGANNQNLITGNPTNNSTASALFSGNSSFAVQITGTWVGTLQFERTLDGGTTWTSIGAFSAGTNFITQTTTQNGTFHGNASSSNGIRVRATAWTSGVASVRILLGAGTGTITVGNPIRLYDQVNNAQATIRASSVQPALTDTALVTASRDKVAVKITGSASSVADVIAAIDVSGYLAFSLQLTGTWVGAVQIQGSNDSFANVDFPAFQKLSGAMNLGGTSIIANGIYKGEINFEQLKIRMTSYTSGTVNAILLLYKEPRPSTSISGIQGTTSISGSVTATVASTTVRAQTYVSNTINSSGDNTIIAAPGVSTRIFITAITVQLETTTTTTILFKSGATTFRRLRCVADGDGISLQYSPGSELRLGVNEAFILNLSGANAVGYSVEYYTA